MSGKQAKASAIIYWKDNIFILFPESFFRNKKDMETLAGSVPHVGSSKKKVREKFSVQTTPVVGQALACHSEILPQLGGGEEEVRK